jgi:pyruvate dehydrogenase E2 component (dihydrolipoamide acetyltransferase)
VRQFAREIGVDIGEVAGSGPGGRISVDDVKAHARAKQAEAFRGPARPAPALPEFSRWGEVDRVPLTNMRQATAQHMALAWSLIPHVTIHEKADISELERLRREHRSKADAAGARLTVTAFLVKIAASALKVFPAFNSSLDTASNELVLRRYISIGVAVDTEKGLMVPVIRNADRMNVLEIALDLGRLAEKARTKRIGPDDLQGGCFSLTNIGSIAGTFFTPIVNHPEVAILGAGRAAVEPVLVDGFFQPRTLMPLSLSFDHRVIDGADGARFLRWIVDAIQHPVLVSLEG